MADSEQETGISSNRSGHWESGGLTDLEIGLCESVASREMKEWGYELSGQKMPMFAIAGSLVALAIKTLLIFTLNWRRAKNLWEMVSRRLAVMGKR